jgi:hypothetical protein
MGNVRVEFHNGALMDTDCLIYDSKNGFVSSGSYVRFHDEATLLEGKGMRFNVDSGTLVLLSEVEAVIGKES